MQVGADSYETGKQAMLPRTVAAKSGDDVSLENIAAASSLSSAKLWNKVMALP
jgi:hypothetical protein